MKYSEKRKAQEIIDDIQSNSFRQRDNDTLLIYLREYSRNFTVLREIADFVAHASRDRGVLNDSIERIMSFFQLNIEYVIAKRPLDLSKPIPSWVLKFIRYQITTLDNNSCRNLLGASKRQVLNRLDKDFRLKGKQALRSKSVLSEPVIQAFKLFIEKPHLPFAPLTQDNLISEMVSVCNLTGLGVDIDLFKNRADQIMACILYLTHQTKFGDREGYSCSSVIGVNNPGSENSIGDIKPKRTLVLQSLISASEPIGEKRIKVNLSHSLILTNLEIGQWTNGVTPVRASNGNYSSIDDPVDLDSDFVLIKANEK